MLANVRTQITSALLFLSAACDSDTPEPQVAPTLTSDASVVVALDAGSNSGPVSSTGMQGGGRDASVSDASVSPAMDAAGGTRPLPDAQGPITPSDAAIQAEAEAGSPAAPSNADANLIPHASWTCGMPMGIPPPERGTLAFRAELTVTALRDVGTTQFGRRQLAELGAGSITGPRLEASLMKGGFELALTLASGAVEVEQVLMLETKDKKPIYLRVCGVAASTADPVRVVMDFEAPNATHGALNSAKLVGVRSLSADGKNLTLSVYDVAQVALPSASVRVEKPSGARAQSWECITGSGQNGAEVYRETVQIGGSVSVGASKRGTRNVIPITGGTTTGRVKGVVLPLGADFQLLGGEFIIDARYIVETTDDELIIVRNCGALGALIPVFEARADGPYAWINEDRWLSSNPSIGLGSVALTIYEKR